MESTSDRYEKLRNAGAEAALAGRLDEAYALLDRALETAHRLGDAGRIDLASCNRAALAIELGDTGGAKAELRRVLMASGEPLARYLAAYSLGRAYDRESEPQKARFYAGIAHRHAQDLDDAERLAESHIQLGNLLLADSDFEQAMTHFESSLGLLSETASIRRCLALDNLGYCWAIKGRLREGFGALFESLRALRRLGARRWLACPHISLCFAYIESERFRHARRHARAALALGEETGDREQIKGALFGLGESEKMAGNLLVARRWFRRLQEDYYPDEPGVSDLLLLLDVKQLVNVKAAT